MLRPVPGRPPRRPLACLLALALALGGCAGVKSSGAPAGAGGARADAGGGTGGSGGATGATDGAAASTDRRPPSPGLVAEVFAHSADTLYVLDPQTKKVTRVGTFDCVGTPSAPGSMVDIAVDRNGKMTGSAAVPAPGTGVLSGALYTIDKSTAHCQMLSRTAGLPPTSLTYVPAGTLLANDEALVGYDDDSYVRVDPATGSVTPIGTLNDAASGGVHWVSSGDIVSITGAGTYLTVTGAPSGDTGGDRIVEVDPKTGSLIRIIGATGVDALLGLGYWAGVAYAFSGDANPGPRNMPGHLFQIDLATGAATPIPIPDAAPDLSFFGAGTTTIAPIVE
jgi:hypothetical protein